MKKKIFLFIITFLFGSIITFPSLYPSFNPDGYCNMSQGFIGYTSTFIAAGRYIIALCYYIFGLLNLSHEVVSIFSIILSNVFLSLSIVFLFNFISKEYNNLYKKILCFLGRLLIYYNPLTLELLVFEEAFAMCFGIFMITLSAIYINNLDCKHRYIISVILLLCAAMCYQGILCLFIPLSIVIYYKKGFAFKDVFIFLLKCILVYSLVYISAYLFMKLIIFIFSINSLKVGHIDLLYNFSIIFGSMKYILTTFFSYTIAKIFWLSLGLFLFLFIILTVKNIKMFYKDYIYFALLIFGSILIAAIPCLFMNSDAVYMACRMCLSVGALHGFLIVMFSKIENLFSDKIYIMYIVLSISLNLYNAYNYLRISNLGYERYNADVIYANAIQNEIEKYEGKTNKKIDKIYFHKDILSDGHYTNDKTLYTVNIKMEGWNFQCGINGLNNENYAVIPMKESDYLKYFKGLNYDSFDSKQFVFKDNTLYLLLY